MPVRITAGDRVFACGRTGSGKTYLMERLTRSLTRLAVLDGKGTLGTWGLAEWNRESRAMLRNQEPVRVRITWDMSDGDVWEHWESILEELYFARNLTIYIDELYALTDNPGTKVQPALRAIYTRGRELGIGAWAATQRPVSVPIVCLSESSHFFMFALTMDDDRAKMAEFMTPLVREPFHDPHGFWYMFAQNERPTYIPALQAGMIKATESEDTKETKEKEVIQQK